MKFVFKTILKDSFCEYEEKKSKFLTFISPVESEEGALKFINSIKYNHKNATHNVYAYLINTTPSLHRYNDDNEPSGTAGMPILECIKKNDLSNIVIVVTRYFGGIKLGASGLVRAYGKSASLGISNSTIVNKVLCNRVSLEISYSLYGKINTYLQNNKIHICNTNFEDVVTLFIYIPKDTFEQFKNSITEITNNNYEIRIESTEYKNFSMENLLIIDQGKD